MTENTSHRGIYFVVFRIQRDKKAGWSVMDHPASCLGCLELAALGTPGLFRDIPAEAYEDHRGDPTYRGQ